MIELRALLETARQQLREKKTLSQKGGLFLLWVYYAFAETYDLFTLSTIRDEIRYKKYLSDKPTAINFVQRYFPADFSKKAKVLDAGCGRGRVAAMLSQLGYDVVGIDIKKNEFWHKIPSQNFVVADVQNIPVKDALFDVCVSFLILEYIADDEKGLKEIYRVLKSDGWFIIQVTNKENLKTKFSGKRIDPTHLREYSIEDIKYLLKSVGFQIELIQTEGFYSPICTRFINSILPRKQWYSLGASLPERERGVICIRSRK